MSFPTRGLQHPYLRILLATFFTLLLARCQQSQDPLADEMTVEPAPDGLIEAIAEEFEGRPGPGEVHRSAVVGGTQGRRGEIFEEDVLPAGAVLAGIQINLSENALHVVRGIRLGIRDAQGEVREATIGHVDGDWQAWHEISEGQTLIGMSGASGWFLDSIQFHFSDSTATPRYGGKGGDTTFDLRLNYRNGQYLGRIRGFYGSLDRQGLETLGFIFDPGE